MVKSLHVLVIDDDPIMREILEALLSLSGCTVELFSSGEPGVARLREAGKAVDVVLTDLHMPGLQGAELAAALQAERTEGTALVGMSGSSPTEDETRLLDSFLQKPFNVEDFYAALEAAQRRATAPATAAGAAPASEAVLDEDTFARLRESFPAEALRGLYELTVSDVRQRIERMKVAAAAGDLDLVHREAHAIKGGCGMVGAVELARLATATEEGTELDAEGIVRLHLACERLEVMLERKLAL
ncbi:response regulator [Granulicella cerasi]|uniref:Response regulator n=1 Tax=Granulicella cerasi TaxID=741063 RepID=A0ABW1ZCY5_9BACT|nr:response regulator [Granulicella cerasi]